MNSGGTVKSAVKLSDSTIAAPTHLLTKGDEFGYSVAGVGDIDGDGVPDILVGARKADNAAIKDAGCAYLLFMNNSGTVKGYRKISTGEGNFSKTLQRSEFFVRL